MLKGKYFSNKLTAAGTAAVAFLVLIAILAPFLANSRPWLWLPEEGGVFFPAVRSFFAPDAAEVFIEKLFNYSGIALVLIALLHKHKTLLICLLLLWLLPFILVKPDTDRRNWRQEKGFRITALIPCGPNESGVTTPYEPPSGKHWLGGDAIGRDVASRMIYGARISLAVGLLATLTAFAIGITVGMISGYKGGLTDLLVMRGIEILICFPSFLLLLILMGMFKDMQFRQSALIVIIVMSLSGWMNLALLVRGETLKLREMAYMQSCRIMGYGVWHTYFVNLLPNLLTPVMISFSFSVAGAILAETTLSFLGFGVQPPTPSWGELLRQAFADPFHYRHLAIAPGVALFMLTAGFNLMGEGIRRTFTK